MHATQIQFQNTKLGFVPSDWALAHLKDVSEIIFSNVDKKSFDEEKPVFLCNYLDVYNNNFITSSIPFMQATANDNEIKKYTLRKWDVIITKDSETQDDIAVPAVVIDDLENVLCGYHLAIIRSNTDKLYGSFLMYLLCSKNVNKEFMRLANGITRFGLNTSSVQNAFIPLPPLLEQKQIAKILSTWDEAISLTEKLIAAKEKFKKGLMQQLLTGKIRLHEYKSEDWKVKKISECCEILDNKRVPLNKDERSKMKGDIPYYGANGVVDHINDFIFNEDIILIAEDGGYFDEYQYRPIAYRVSNKSWVNNHAHVLRAKANFSQDFIFFSLEHRNILKYLNGGTRSKLNKSELLNIPIAMPYNGHHCLHVAGTGAGRGCGPAYGHLVAGCGAVRNDLRAIAVQW